MTTNPPTFTTPKHFTFSSHPVHKTLASAANLANLLPTGSVLAFRTLTPPFSNKGMCRTSNKCLMACLVAFCSIICLLSTFTDSFMDCDGKLYYGFATFKGLYVFNSDYNDGDVNGGGGHSITLETISSEFENNNNNIVMDMSKFRINSIDFVHGFVSLFVFLAFALSDSDVQTCFFPYGGEDLEVLAMNLPLAAGVFASFVFTIVPTTRRGIGYADMPSKFK